MDQEEELFYVRCIDCGASASYSETREEAIEAWNGRVEKLKVLEYVLQNHYNLLRWQGWDEVFALGDMGAPMAMFKTATLSDLVEDLEEWLEKVGKNFPVLREVKE